LEIAGIPGIDPLKLSCLTTTGTPTFLKPPDEQVSPEGMFG
jgi:hypothetical protein